MIIVRLANPKDIEFLEENDKHIFYDILKESIDKGRIYVLELDDKKIGWLRYNLFWDNTPFMNLLYILEEYRNQGYGTLLLEHWENQMQIQGYTTLMTSTLVHESAIHFYLKHGYQAVGGFHPNEEEYEVILKK